MTEKPKYTVKIGWYDDPNATGATKNFDVRERAEEWADKRKKTFPTLPVVVFNNLLKSVVYTAEREAKP